MYGLKSESIKKIASDIGLVFVGDIQLNNLPRIISKNIHTDDKMAYGIAYEINKRLFSKFPEHFKFSISLLREWEKIRMMPFLTEQDSYKKVLALEPWIMEKGKNLKDEEMTKKKQMKTEKLPLSSSLEKYPHLGEQLISEGALKLRIFSTPVRPSIKNWITDFHDVMGSKKHSPIDRGNFLFHSEKVAAILKSLDEETPLTIDADSQMVIFDNLDQSQVQEVEQQKSVTNNFSEASNLKFSSPQNPSSMNGSGTFQTQASKFVSENIRVDMGSNKINLPERNFQEPLRKKEDFFALPQSKPPIGSEHYDAEKSKDMLNSEKSYNFSASKDTVKDFGAGFANKEKSRSAFDNFGEVEIMERDFSSKGRGGAQGEVVIDMQRMTQKDMDAMSDDALFKLLQEKKLGALKNGTGRAGTGYSPQRISAVANPAQVSSTSVIKTNQFPIQAGRSPYKITPSDYRGVKSNTKTLGVPKVTGNMVDLRANQEL